MYKQVIPDGTSAIHVLEKKLEDKGLFIRGHSTLISSLSISSDNRYIISVPAFNSKDYDSTIRVWDIQLRKQVAKYTLTNQSVTCAIMSPDNKFIITGSSEKILSCYNFFKPHKKIVSILTKSSIDKIVVIDSSELVVGCVDYRGIQVWNLNSGLLDLHIKTEEVWVAPVALNSDFSVCGTHNGLLRIYNFGNDCALASIRVSQTKFSALAISKNSQIIAFSLHSSVSIFSQSNPAEISEILNLPGGQSHICISHDNNWIVSLNKKSIISISSIEKKVLIKILKCEESPATSLALTDEFIVVGCGKEFSSNQNFVILYQLNGEEKFVFEGHCRIISCIEVSENWKFVVSGGFDHTVRCWDVEKNREAAVLRGHTAAISCLRLSEKGKLLASGSLDSNVRVWDLIRYQQIAVINESTKWIRHVLISELENKVFFSAFNLTCVKIFNILERELREIPIRDIREIGEIYLSKSSKYIVVKARPNPNNSVLVYKNHY